MPDSGQGQSQIDVSLSLLSSKDSQAANALAKALQDVSKMLSAISASGFMQSAKDFAKFAESMQRSGRDHPNQWSSSARRQAERAEQTPGGLYVPPSVGGGATRPEAPDVQEAEADAKVKLGGYLRKRVSKRAKKGDFGLPGTGGADWQMYGDEGGDMGGDAYSPERRGGASTPQGNYGGISRFGKDPRIMEARQNLDLSMVDKPFRLPPEGHIPIDYALRQGLGGMFMKRAARASTADDVSKNLDLANEVEARANQYARVKTYAHYAQTGHQNLQRVNANFGTGLTDVGRQLGYGPGATLGGSQFGMQLPFSGGWGEGARQKWDQARLGFQPGISPEQAGAMTQVANQYGFSGDQGNNMKFRYMAPTVRETGVNPELLGPASQDVRAGVQTWDQLRNSVKGLGQTAKEAQMPVDELQQSLNEVGEAAQQSGGYFNEGHRTGTSFAQAFGDPKIATALQNNGFFQAKMMARTHILPFAQGAIPGSIQAAVASQTLDQMTNRFLPQMEDQQMQLPGGKAGDRYTLSARRQAEAASAKMLNLTPDQVAMMRNRKGEQEVQGLGGAYLHHSKDWAAFARKHGYSQYNTAQEDKFHQDRNETSWSDLRQKLSTVRDQRGVKEFGPQELAKLDKMRPDRRAKEIGHQIAARRQIPVVHFELKGMAARLLGLDKKNLNAKDLVNAGLQVANDTGVIGANPLDAAAHAAGDWVGNNL